MVPNQLHLESKFPMKWGHWNHWGKKLFHSAYFNLENENFYCVKQNKWFFWKNLETCRKLKYTCIYKKDLLLHSASRGEIIFASTFWETWEKFLWHITLFDHNFGNSLQNLQHVNRLTVTSVKKMTVILFSSIFVVFFNLFHLNYQN